MALLRFVLEVADAVADVVVEPDRHEVQVAGVEQRVLQQITLTRTVGGGARQATLLVTAPWHSHF